VLKKPSHKNAEVVDVPADDPVGTMDCFTAGLRRIIQTPKGREIPKREIRPRRSGLKRRKV